MPPRAVKRGSGTPTPKKMGLRPPKGTPKSHTQNDPVEETVKIEEVSVSIAVEEEIKTVVDVPDQKTVDDDVPDQKTDLDSNGSASVKEEERLKEVFDEDDHGERLELEDNEPESEADEEAGVDYGDREIDHDDGQEGEEVEEEANEIVGGEGEEGDMIEEGMEDDGEDIEGGRDEENGVDEHDDIVDGEEEEHHEVVTERRKRKEFEIFAGGLDKDATEDDLKKVFSEVGEVVEVRLMINPQTKKNKGFAFIRFATVEQAKRAVSELKNPTVNGKQCGVSPSQDSDTLFLGNICKTWTKDHLKDKLKHYGVENVEDLTLVEDTSNEGMNRGFAFLEFSYRSDAMDALKRLQRRDVVFGVDRSAKVALADSFTEPDDEVMAQVKTVFVDGLPASWDEDRVKENLEKFGVIEKIELARNMPSARRKDFGFISFDTHDAAVVCAEGINNVELGEGDNKVKVRARLSRPRQRGRMVKRGGARGDFRVGLGPSRGGRGSWGRGGPHIERRFPSRGVARGIGSRGSPMGSRGFKRPFGFQGRRPIMQAPTERARHLPPPERSYRRRPPVSAYPKSSFKRDYGRRDEFPPISRPAFAERRTSYRDDYPVRGSSYLDSAPPRNATRSAARRSYADEGYGRRLEKPPPSYREGRSREYDSVSGSKRPYSAVASDAPRYADSTVRQSRARLDYGVSSGASQYGNDGYSESSRLGRSHIGYGGGGRSSIAGHDSHGLYDTRPGTAYGGSASGSDVGGMYSSSFGSDYLSRGDEIASGSYSSLYSGRSLSNNYLGGGSGSGSYY